MLTRWLKSQGVALALSSRSLLSLSLSLSLSLTSQSISGYEATLRTSGHVTLIFFKKRIIMQIGAPAKPERNTFSSDYLTSPQLPQREYDGKHSQRSP